MQKTLFSLMVFLYVSAGIYHFINSEIYLKVMPAYFPNPKFWVLVSGACEIVLAILLLFKSTKKLAAWLIIAMLTVFFTVHVQMIINGLHKTGLDFWVPLIRFPLQFLLIRWAFVYTKITLVK